MGQVNCTDLTISSFCNGLSGYWGNRIDALILGLDTLLDWFDRLLAINGIVLGSVALDKNIKKYRLTESPKCYSK